MSLLIHDATVSTVDPARRVFAPGAVYVGTRIADVGPSEALRARHPHADRVVDGHRKVVVPGFVSTHTHVGYTVFRGRVEDAGLGCVTRQYFPMATVLRREERLAIGALTYAELLRSGVTTVLEMEEDADVLRPVRRRAGRSERDGGHDPRRGRRGALPRRVPLRPRIMNAVRGHVAPVQDLRARGVTVSLGIDNMFADFFEVLRLCVLVARIRGQDAVTMPSMEAIELATRAGARALGLEGEIGSIESRQTADLVVLECRAFGLTPTLDPVQNLVYHAHARDVHMVLVDGAILVEDGRLRTVDAPTLVDRAQEAALAAWSRFVAKYGGWEA